MARLLLIIFITIGFASSEEVPPPAIPQEKIEQWVTTMKTASSESASWTEQKEMLLELISLREHETEKLDEVIGLAKERITDVESKKAALTGEAQRRQAWRNQFEHRLKTIEDLVAARLGYLPKPVVDKVFDAVERIKNRTGEEDLQTRIRDVISILNECSAFNNEIHMLPEIHEFDGKQIEVDVIYLGMNQAWYVDRTNRLSGVGKPGESGWEWTEEPSIAGNVRRAIDIHTKKAPPAFVKLPVSNSNAAN